MKAQHAVERSGLDRRELLRTGALSLGAALTAPILAGCSTTGSGTNAAATTHLRLGPFYPHAPRGGATGLPGRIAWANTAETEIFAALGHGMQQAAQDRSLDFLTADASGDPDRNIDQINTFLARGVGGITIQPLDVASQTPVLEQALSQGVCVSGIITNPSILQVAASQYRIGYQQGKSAADYIRAHLGGKATVFNANQDAIPQLAVRNRGVLAGLRTGGPGVKVIDQYVPVTDQTTSGAFTYIQVVLERYPDIKVVLGDDTPVLGFYQGIQAAGALTEDMYFGGVDGDTGALELIRRGTPYRASAAFAWPLMGYGMGQFFADWIEGGQIPRIMVANTTLIDSPAKAAAFEAANADLSGTFTDRAHYERYFPLLGNVSYGTRHLVWHQNYEP